jgi:hypothetical protein
MNDDDRSDEWSLRSKDSDFDDVEVNDWSLDDSMDDTLVSTPYHNGTASHRAVAVYGYESFYPSLAGLLDSENEIRILALNPAVDEAAPISCHLHSRPRDSSETYEALSYTWGRPSKDLAITVNHYAFPVRENLYAALRRLRFRNCIRKLWVDAICINQNDLTERAIQVRKMGEVYQKAARVVIWLGDCSEPTTNEIFDIVAPHEWKSFPRLWQVRQEQNHQVRSLLSVTVQAEPNWWTRAWIVQEIVVSQREPLVAFGELTMPYTDFKDFLKILAREQWPHTLSSFFDANAKHLLMQFDDHLSNIQALKEYRQSQLLPLVEALLLTRGMDAADSLDTVFSLLSMIPERESLLIPVDYTMTLHKLSVTTAKAAFMSGTDYTYLLLKRFEPNVLNTSRGKTTDAQYPSWVPDLADIRTRPFHMRTSRISFSTSASCEGQQFDGACEQALSSSQFLATSMQWLDTSHGARDLLFSGGDRNSRGRLVSCGDIRTNPWLAMGH